jgi:hypothetical protein
MITIILDDRLATFSQLLKPWATDLARRAARRWVAGNLAPRLSNCPLGPTGLKALFEQGCDHHLPLADFTDLLVAAGLMRNGVVYATILE